MFSSLARGFKKGCYSQFYTHMGYNGILVPVRTIVLVCIGVAIKRRMYQCKVDVDMMNAVKSILADVSSVSPSSEQRGDYGLGESLYRVRVH